MSAIATELSPELEPLAETPSSWNMLFWRFRRNRKAVAGAIIIGFLLFLMIFAPWIAPKDPLHGDLGSTLAPPGRDFLLGADRNGRDVLSRLIWGSRTALGGAFAVVLISELIGVPLGIIAGYRGGWFDTIVSRILDVMLAFPPLLLSLAIVAAFGPSLKNVVISLGILYVPFIARVVRGVTLVQREMTYSEAAKAMGYPKRRIIFRHILPNCLGPVIVVSTLDLAYAMLDLAALSFLGLGVQPPTPDWGAMLSEGQGVLLTSPHLSLAAGFMILHLGARLQSARRRSERRARPTTGATLMSDAPILELDDLQVAVLRPAAACCTRSTASVSRSLPAKRSGLVGESGSGKSVTARAIMRLVPTPPGPLRRRPHPLRREGSAHALRRRDAALRGGQISMVFQDPMTFLNPVYTAGEQVAEAIRTHQGASRAEAKAQTIELFRTVGIPNAEARFSAYPHELSGGLRQRVMISMALSSRPKLLIADEPTTALDVTIQAQILDLLRNLQQEFGMSILLITHDLGVVAEMCDKVAVMYAGRIVEEASIEPIFDNPGHPVYQRLAGSDSRMPVATARPSARFLAPRPIWLACRTGAASRPVAATGRKFA